MSYCLYLRKSRKDLEAESHGEGETLARHEKILLDLARHYNYDITQIYREIVSGESLLARPVMQQLLVEVEQGLWDGVLVVEVERLARGNTIDQGMVAQAFQCSNTKIITPAKIYDPNNEFDEEYFEFGLFMSRREYKTINRRLQQGRIAATKEGKYVSGGIPYGYRRIKLKNEKGYTLQIEPEEAKVVRLIYDMYTTPEDCGDGTLRHIGMHVIARRLDALGIPSPSGLNVWPSCTVHQILTNPVYNGKIRWSYEKYQKIVENGKIKHTRRKNNNYLLVDGLHEAIIPDKLFNKTQEILSSRPPHISNAKMLVNPLSGIVVCKLCGHNMVMFSSNRISRIRCGSPQCPTQSTQLKYVEQRILDSLSEWLQSFTVDVTSSQTQEFRIRVENAEKMVKSAKINVTRLKSMLTRIHELLEQGVYDIDTFLDRSRALSEQLSSAEAFLADSLAKLDSARLSEANIKNIAPKVAHIIEIYNELPSAQAKNDMLKEVLDKVEYYRIKRTSHTVPKDAFELTLFPKLPKSE